MASRGPSSGRHGGWGSILDVRMELAGLAVAETALEQAWRGLPLGERSERVGAARRGFPLDERTGKVIATLDVRKTTTRCRAIDGAEVRRAFAAALGGTGGGGGGLLLERLGGARPRLARFFEEAGVSPDERARVQVLFLSWTFGAAPQLLFRLEGSSVGFADECAVFAPWGRLRATVTHDVDAWGDADKELTLFDLADETSRRAGEVGQCHVALEIADAAPPRRAAPAADWARLRGALGLDDDAKFPQRLTSALVQVGYAFGVDLHLEEAEDPELRDIVAGAARGHGGG